MLSVAIAGHLPFLIASFGVLSVLWNHLENLDSKWKRVYYGSKVATLPLSVQKILNRNNWCRLEKGTLETTEVLQEQFEFWSWIFQWKDSYSFHGWLFFRWICFQGRGKGKGRQILTPLQWKTVAEAKQQNLLSCKILHTVYWTDS